MDKSRKAPKQIRSALEQGAELIFVWGGDGMVQRCVDVLAGTDATMAIVPAGTANLFASNLGIPKKIDGAVEAGLHGQRRKLDVGDMNGEKFAVMAGVGFDALVIHAADSELKRKLRAFGVRLGGGEEPSRRAFEAQIEVDGKEWYSGHASCVLFGNVGEAFAGVKAFKEALPDDGLLDIGVASADGVAQWGRTLARSALSDVNKSPFVHLTKGESVQVKLSRKVLYELDGGDREKKKTFQVDIQPGAVNVCVPAGKT